ncbi:chemotaxis protein CheW [Pseudomonas lini]
MNPLIDISDLSLWLFVALAPGLVVLVALGIRYRGNPRIDIQASAPIEPLVEVEPDNLERINRHAIEQLSAISEVLRSSTATAIKPVDKPASRFHLSVPGVTISEAADATRDKNLTELADKMCHLTRLASHMLDKRQALVGTAIGSLSAADTTTPNRHYLSFTLGGEPFAVSTSGVYAIVEATQLITGKGMSPRFRRAIRLRNALVPVIDLGAHFGGRPIEIGPSTSIVILEVICGERMQMIGVVVDAVGKVLEIPSVDVEPAAASDSRIRNDFILGTVTINNHGVTLLDIERGFSANEFVVLRPAAPIRRVSRHPQGPLQDE